MALEGLLTQNEFNRSNDDEDSEMTIVESGQEGTSFTFFHASANSPTSGKSTAAQSDESRSGSERTSPNPFPICQLGGSPKLVPPMLRPIPYRPVPVNLVEQCENKTIPQPPVLVCVQRPSLDCESDNLPWEPNESSFQHLKSIQPSSPLVISQDSKEQNESNSRSPTPKSSSHSPSTDHPNQTLSSPSIHPCASASSNSSPEPELLELDEKMTTPRSKSPRPVTPKRDDESFWDKFGTLGRKKKIKEVQDCEEEGKNAIDSPGSPLQFDLPPEEYDLADGEQRSLIERRSYANPKLQQLMRQLIDWLNDELADQRIIVRNLEDDLYDGQVLQKLLEKLTGQKLEVPEVSQSSEGQRHKLEVVLNHATNAMGLPRWTPQKWTVDVIHSKGLVGILYLLVALVRYFRAPLRLPENVTVETVVVKKKDGKLDYRRVAEEITSTYDEFGMRCEPDAFDTLLDHAPDKLQLVEKSLTSFANKHLNKINLEVTDLQTQFQDGVYLTLLMGLLEGYFVPLSDFHLTPNDFEQKVFNVAFAFELMEDAGIGKPKARPEDIVNADLKSTLRVLYNLFAKYRHINST